MGSQIVILIFSNSNPDRSPESWRKIIEAIHQQIAPESKTDINLHFVDQDAGAQTGRVASISLPASSPKTLSDCKTLVSQFQPLEAQYGIEIIAQPSELYWAHVKPGLAVFDMDSTLIQQEVIDELARAVGLYDQVAAITEAAMRGEEPYTDFEASLRARVALLRGVPTSIWEDMKRDIISFTPGAKELLKVLKKLGWKTAVLSGGFIPLASWVKDTLGMDYAFANHLVADEGKGELTGELEEGKAIIHGQKKKELLLRLASGNGMSREKIIAVGDGSNDLPMMGAAGLGVAFNAKPRVQEKAPTRLNSGSLKDVLYLLGYEHGEVKHLLEAEGS